MVSDLTENEMTPEATPDAQRKFRSRRGGSTLTSRLRVQRDASSRRRRRLLIIVSPLIACLTAWQMYPNWRMHALAPAIKNLRNWRDRAGRYPMSKPELDDALAESGSSILGTTIEFGGDLLRDTGVKYRVYENGTGYSLHFNFDRFWKFGDTNRYEYESGDDSWGDWYD